MKCYSENISPSGIELNDYGKIVAESWLNLSHHFNYCEADEFMVMPNHFHGIIFIHEIDVGHRPACASPQADRLHEKLPVIIGSLKSSVSKKIHEAGLQTFRWQRSYFDRIIRNEKELLEIRKYIINNPLKSTLRPF